MLGIHEFFCVGVVPCACGSIQGTLSLSMTLYVS
jgi:hypothetical protein